MNAEHRLLPACEGMLGLTACRDGYIRVHDAPALRAVSDRRVVAPVIHVLTRIGLVELCSHSVGPFVAPAEARRVEAKRLAKVLEGPYAIRARQCMTGSSRYGLRAQTSNSPQIALSSLLSCRTMIVIRKSP